MLLILLLTFTGLGIAPASKAAGEEADREGVAEWPPLQLEMLVPFDPTVYSSEGHDNLTYELYLRNLGNAPLVLQRLEVLDGNGGNDPLATYEDEQFSTLLHPVGAASPATEGLDPRRIDAGGSAIVFLSVALDEQGRTPALLRHRLFVGDSVVDGALAGTRQTELLAVRPPLRGQNWQASGGPDNSSGHRRGVLVTEGVARISRRYAMDWIKTENGAAFAGNQAELSSYHSYGEPVFAIADGTVVSVQDSMPENTPGTRDAVPVRNGAPTSSDAVSGNFVTLALGNGQFARYLHLQPGSLRVRTGDRVLQGQLLANVGNSGDSSRPHLHFEITTSPDLLNGEGIPYLIDEFRVTALESGITEVRRDELPFPGNGKLFSFE